MAVPSMSLQKLKEMHKALGGNRKGYYITLYGNDVATGKTINISHRVAKNVRRNASADYYLVKGKTYTKRK